MVEGNDSRPHFPVALGLMARAPSSPGKTRLAPELSPARLAGLRAALLADAVDLLTRTPGVDPFMFFTPADAEPTRFGAPAIPLIAQRGDDLGARMNAAFEDLLQQRGYDAAILIGADCPLLTPQHIADAVDLLQRGPNRGRTPFSARSRKKGTARGRDTLVLGPADDGGYYLIGMRHVHSDLFAGVAWGSDSVLTDTRRLADRLGVGARLMRGGYDVDTIADLRRLERDLPGAPPALATHVRRWFSERS